MYQASDKREGTTASGVSIPFHRKREARTAIRRLRKIIDNADQFDISAFPRRRQRVGKARIGTPGGVEESGHADRDSGDEERCGACDPAPDTAGTFRIDRASCRHQDGKEESDN
ncbi:MAG: hypothetical protein M3Z74_08160 [Pseudomonadota bacterium]|nr:hypothetical protein [Pseudomonadota bacterium]